MKGYDFTRFILVIIIFISTCGKQPLYEPDEKILVNIDDRTTISVDEFIRRAEYTVRPPYCKFNSYIHKKIILNSLIAEKLLALEAGQENELLNDKEFQGYIRGRKEQAMRQWMHHIEATAKVKLDTSDIKKIYRMAGREYRIAYYSVTDSTILANARNRLAEDNSYFETFFIEMGGDSTIPTRKVSWSNQDHEKIQEAMFHDELKPGQVLAPIKIDNNDYLIIKILGWNDTPALTPGQLQQRWDNVAENLTLRNASAIWKKRVGAIMKGKRIDFFEDTFLKVNNIFFATYFTTDADKKLALKEAMTDDSAAEVKYALPGVTDPAILNLPFFEIDEKIWTVEDFRQELISHPLVFRKRKMSSTEFPEQFKLAVVDLIRDHYVTQQAYDRSYDNVNVVRRNENMWRDAFLARYQKEKYLKSIGEKRNFNTHYLAIISGQLNSYVDSLQKKYYKKIQLDFDEFENIVLTGIDLFVKQKDQPYQHVVPMFPILTTDNKIEYIRRIRNVN